MEGPLGTGVGRSTDLHSLRRNPTHTYYCARFTRRARALRVLTFPLSLFLRRLNYNVPDDARPLESPPARTDTEARKQGLLQGYALPLFPPAC